jgi:hypothetical protein
VFPARYEHYLYVQKKDIPVTGCGDLRGSILTYCLDNRHNDGGGVFGLKNRPRSIHFC